jgi:hypothetical protein
MFLFLKCHPLETGPPNFAASWSRQDIYIYTQVIMLFQLLMTVTDSYPSNKLLALIMLLTDLPNSMNFH